MLKVYNNTDKTGLKAYYKGKGKHMEQQKHLFTNKMLWALLIPIIMEQLLNALMGTGNIIGW